MNILFCIIVDAFCAAPTALMFYAIIKTAEGKLERFLGLFCVLLTLAAGICMWIWPNK